MENLKFIIEELNKIFSSDYNCFTFNNLTTQELLQVILDVMQHLGIVENRERGEGAAEEIFNKLGAIKYSSHPDELKSGLHEGKREVIHAVLTFLLKNQANVITRNYLSQYVNQIEIPQLIKKGDVKIGILEKQYATLVEDFWKAYSSNKLEKSWASEAKELEEDIWQMRLDTGNLTKRLNLQKDKLSDVDEDRMDSISAFCAEEKRNAKLVKQLEVEKQSLEDLNELHLFYMKRKNVAGLEDFLENVEMNKQNHSLIGSLCEELKTDLSVMKRVTEEEHPDSATIESLQQQVYHLQNQLRDLKIKAGEPFTRDRVLRKKKDLTSKQILKLQAKNDSMVGKISEYLSLLGGDVLTGKSLKEYVAKLRQSSLVYKECKKQLNALESERSVLKETLQVLATLNNTSIESDENNTQTDNNIKKFARSNSSKNMTDNSSKFSNNDNSSITNNSSYLTPITKHKYTVKFNEFAAVKNDIILIKNKRDELSETYAVTLAAFDENKTEFEHRAGDLIAEISALEFAYENLNEAIQAELTALNEYVEQAEEFKESLLRYSQCFIENAESVELLEGNLKALREKNVGLAKEAEGRRARLEGVKVEMEAVKLVQEMVVLKLNSQIYD